MPNVNLVVLIGTLTRDPESRFTGGGSQVARFGLAVNHKYTASNGEKREEVCFLDIELWQKLAELATQFLKKGQHVYLQGRLVQDTWDDKTTGQKRSKLKVVADTMQFLTGQKGNQERHTATPSTASASPAQPDPDLDPDDQEIPF